MNDTHNVSIAANEPDGNAKGRQPKRKPPSEWKKTPRMKAIKDKEPDFIGKLELARNLCCHIQTINEWIFNGTVPPPHSRPGLNHPIWLRSHYRQFVETGSWPDEAWPIRKVQKD